MEINVVGGNLRAVTFSADGKHVLSGDKGGVQVWRVEDRKQTATMETRFVWCLAVSKDNRWIVVGTLWGDVHVWDVHTHEQVWTHKQDFHAIRGVDFSPDSTRLTSASANCTAVVWDIATREKVQTLHHKDPVISAKYSLQGDRIATVYDSNDGCLLVDIKVGVTPRYNGLLWYNNHLLVISDGKINQLEASTGSVISEWPLPDMRNSQCIAIPKHGKFIAYSVERTVTF